MKLRHEFLNGQKECFPELTVKDYKTFLKICYGEGHDLNEFVEDILQALADYSLKSVDYWRKFTLYDVLDCLTAIRCVYVGDAQKLSFEDMSDTYVELSYTNLRAKLAECYTPFFGPQAFVSDNEWRVWFVPPSIKEMQDNGDSPLAPYKFVSAVEYEGQTISVDVDNKDNLPARVGMLSLQRVREWKQKATQTMLLPQGVDRSLWFDNTFASFYVITKLLFLEDLEGFYSNVFQLSRLAHLSPAYIEQCEPGEYLLFVKKLEFAIAQQRQQQAQGEINMPVDTPFPEE